MKPKVYYNVFVFPAVCMINKKQHCFKMSWFLVLSVTRYWLHFPMCSFDVFLSAKPCPSFHPPFHLHSLLKGSMHIALATFKSICSHSLTWIIPADSLGTSQKQTPCRIHKAHIVDLWYHIQMSCFMSFDYRHFNLRMKRDSTLFAQDLKVDVSGEEVPYDTSHIYTGEIYGKTVLFILIYIYVLRHS